MVYPIEKILKIVASFFRFLRSSPKNAENSIFLICALKKSSERWFETHLLLKIAQLTLEICFWKFILSFEARWYFLWFIQTKKKEGLEKHKILAKMDLNLFL